MVLSSNCISLTANIFEKAFQKKEIPKLTLHQCPLYSCFNWVPGLSDELAFRMGVHMMSAQRETKKKKTSSCQDQSVFEDCGHHFMEEEKHGIRVLF